MTTSRRTSIYIDGFAHTNPIPVAARVGGLVYSSLITGRDPATGRQPDTLDQQATFMFQHLRAVVAASGARLDDIIKVTLWLKDRSDRDAVNREWLEMFPDPDDRPARQAHAADLADGVLVQCDFVAVVGEAVPE